MKFSPRHLACLIILLSSLSSADASMPQTTDFTVGGHYIGMLLAREQAALAAEPIPEPRSRDLSHLDLPIALVAQHRPAFAMRPPSAHSMQLQAATSFGA
jgi:hypothetical protein